MSVNNNQSLVDFTKILPADPLIGIFSNFDRAARGVIARVNKRCRDIVSKMDLTGFEYVARIANVLSTQSSEDETESVPEKIEKALIEKNPPSYVVDAFNIRHLQMELDHFKSHINGDEKVLFDMNAVWNKLISLGYIKLEEWMCEKASLPSILDIFNKIKKIKFEDFLGFIKKTPYPFMKFTFAIEYLNRCDVSEEMSSQLLNEISDKNMRYLYQYRLIESLVNEKKFDEAIKLEKALVDPRNPTDCNNTTTTKFELQNFIFTNLIVNYEIIKARSYMESIPDDTTQGLMSLILPQG